MNSLWLYRPLLNWQDIYAWAHSVGVKKIMPRETLHTTILTVHTPCELDDLDLLDNEIHVPAGLKTIQLFGWTVKALTFGHPEIKERHDELSILFPKNEHPILRPHVSLFRGGKMISECYEGALIFGPEIAKEFNGMKGRRIKHVEVSDFI